jgi:hypothetical protein
MRRVWMLSVIAVTFMLGLGSRANAQSVPPGSYQQTCNNIDFRNDVLAANCQDSSGHWQSALLRDVQGCRSDIINDDGSLRCSRGVAAGYPGENHAGLPGGVYTQSCQDIRIHGDDLEARCPTASGDWKNAKLDDYGKCHGDIVNDNGKLRCIVTPGYQAGYTTNVAVGVISGPYTQTCKDIKSHDNYLEARCQTKNGDWHKTSLDDFQGCHGQIVNEDGYLHCVAGAGFVGNAPYGAPVASYQNGLPGGSYTQSCDGIRIHGDDLEAHCQTKDGGSHNAKLDDFQKCKSEIINDDGKLRCEK